MYIGIDLGGTNIKAALVDKGHLVKKLSTACPASESEVIVIETLCGLITELINKQVTGIGAGIPSVLDREKGIVYNAANIPSWQEVHKETHKFPGAKFKKFDTYEKAIVYLNK